MREDRLRADVENGRRQLLDRYCPTKSMRATFQDFTSDTILPKNVLLRFFPIHSIQPPYTVKWQITNTGNEAKIAGGLRGDKFEDSELSSNGILCGKKESTSYTGMHYIQCFIIKNGNQCVGMSKPFIVNIQ